MKHLIKKGDLILAAIFLASAVLIGCSSALRSAAGSAAADSGETELAVKIEVDGEEYMTVSLDEDQVITVTTDYGTNVITIGSGAVCVSEADCGNQVCVNTGAVSTVGRMIVCLPHRLSVEIVTIDGTEPEYDAISY